jgi:hypothetical protein
MSSLEDLSYDLLQPICIFVFIEFNIIDTVVRYVLVPGGIGSSFSRTRECLCNVYLLEFRLDRIRPVRSHSFVEFYGV